MSEALLLIDNSNTLTKFARICPGESAPQEIRTFPTAEISPATLRDTLAGWEFGHAVLCSVAPQAAAALREGLGLPLSEISSASCPHLLRGYPAPETLGADRIANAAAVACLYPLPCVAVDLGTACTFDLIVDEEDGPRFAGGAISPGLHTAAKALAGHTARLPLFSPAELRHTPPPAALGQNTRQAMLAGLRYGYLGMVQGVLREMSRALPCAPFVVLTGGDAELLHGHLELNHQVDKLLTIKGILNIHRQSNPLFCR